MFKVNKKAEYALMALQLLQSNSKMSLITAKDVCQVYKIPFDATSRVMQIMAQKGLLESTQGAHGGYRLSKSLDTVSFYDFLKMILGELALVKCISVCESVDESNQEFKEGYCEKMDFCQLKNPLTLLQEKVNEFYKSIYLNQILQPSNFQPLKSYTEKNFIDFEK